MKSRMSRFYRFVILSSVVASVFVCLVAGFVYYQYLEIIPDVSILKNSYPVALNKLDRKIMFVFQQNKPSHWRSIQQIPKKAVWAVLTSEDIGFFDHQGYDPSAMESALAYNLRSDTKIVKGGSTITQQVVKNLFLSHEKTLDRKLRELILSVDMEHALTKNQILELYLNIAEWGSGIYGIEMASRHYFSKPATELNVREGAILAFMLPNPIRYQHSFKNGELTEFGAARVNDILSKMKSHGRLTDDEFISFTHAETTEAKKFF